MQKCIFFVFISSLVFLLNTKLTLAQRCSSTETCTCTPNCSCTTTGYQYYTPPGLSYGCHATCDCDGTCKGPGKCTCRPCGNECNPVPPTATPTPPECWRSTCDPKGCNNYKCRIESFRQQGCSNSLPCTEDTQCQECPTSTPTPTSSPTPTSTPTPTGVVMKCENYSVNPSFAVVGNQNITVNASYTFGNPYVKYGIGQTSSPQSGSVSNTCQPAPGVPCAFSINTLPGDYIYTGINLHYTVNETTYTCNWNGSWGTNGPPNTNPQTQCINTCSKTIPVYTPTATPTLTFTPTYTPTPTNTPTPSNAPTLIPTHTPTFTLTPTKTPTPTPTVTLYTAPSLTPTPTTITAPTLTQTPTPTTTSQLSSTPTPTLIFACPLLCTSSSECDTSCPLCDLLNGCIAENTPTPSLPPQGTTASTTPPIPTQQAGKIFSTVTPPREQTVRSFMRPSQPQQWTCLSVSESSNSKNGELLLTSSLVFPKLTDIFIVACIQSGSVFSCTTGNSSQDTKLGFAKSSSHTFAMVSPQYNPIRFPSDQNGISVKVLSVSSQITTHTFYAVFEIPADTGDGSGSSLSYSTFQVDQSSTNCTAVRWDPYGYVLDDETYKPLSNIQIAITDPSGNYIRIPGLNNPVLTDSKGYYSFMVPPGEYKLLVFDPKNQYVINNNPTLYAENKCFDFNPYKIDSIIYEKKGTSVKKDILMKKQR